MKQISRRLKMYYRKHEDNRRHKKVADESSGYPHA